MASLIVEYRQRYRMDFVLPADEGVLFFDVNKKPAAVALISSLSKNNTTCRNCNSHRAGLISEIFIPTNKNLLSLKYHDHIGPDIDLNKYVNERLNSKAYVPYIANGDRDAEGWLWRYFLQVHKIKFTNITSKNSNMRTIEQMLFCVANHPKLYELYYKSLYQTLLIGRKYLLLS